MSKNPTERVRVTSATEQRTHNLKRIVERLSRGELKRHELQELLCMSPSGARKYVQDLMSANVMVIAYRESHYSWRHNMDRADGAPVYALNPDTEVVDAFLALLESDPKKAKKFAEVEIPDPDAPKQNVTSSWKCKPVKHWDVHAAFFGLAPAAA